MKETHFQKWWETVKVDVRALPDESDVSEVAWNAAIQLAMVQLRQVGRFGAAEQISHLLTDDAKHLEDKGE